MTNANTALGGVFTLPGTTTTLRRMGYGAMRLSGPHVFGPPKDEAAAVAVLREAVAAGVNHIDTSDFYGPHVTNRLIKKALHPYPAGLTLVTKLGARRPADGSWVKAMTPEDLTAGLHDNLRNLGLDAMDVVNLRLWSGPMRPPAEGPFEDALGVLIDLKAKGLIRHIGLSHATAKQVERARVMTDLVCVQNEYNLAKRGDDALIDTLAAAGVAYVPYFPLGGFSPLQSDTLSKIAAAAGATPLQVALAWLLHRSPNVLLIPGTSSTDHLRENLAAADLRLSPPVMAELDAIGANR